VTLLSQRREVGEFRKRYKWMALVAVLTLGGLLMRQGMLSLVEHDEWSLRARQNITKTISLPATRGLLRDTNGHIIADNRPSYDVLITPQFLDPERDVDTVARLMGLDADAKESFRARLDAVPLRRRTHQIRMFTDITRDQLAALETHARDLPGVDVVATPVRRYPYGSLAAHAIGYLNEVSADDLDAHPGEGYRAGDVVGRTGVERAFESYLRGHRGFRRILVDARGRHQEDHDGLAPVHETTEEPIPGRDLVLTLDMDLMNRIQRAFRGEPSGAVVVVDVHTGRIRALYSKPSYDLGEISGRLSAERYRELLDDPFRPLIDKTIYASYFPGSTFKPFTALSALEMPDFDPERRYNCPGYFEIGHQRLRCTSVHGDFSMHPALVHSCNVYFWHIAELVGLERLNTFGRDFGLGARTGVGINSESSGFLADRAWYIEHYGRYKTGYTLNTAIGQGNTRVTVLQMALAYAALANGGDLYAPQLVEAMRTPDGTIIEQFPPRLRHHIDVTPEHLAYVVSGLRGVVNEQGGTAYAARIEGGVIVAGKTGTAEVARRRLSHRDPRRAWYFNRSHAWFGGFAPADNPEIAIIVLVEHGGAGGRTAAPIAMRVIQDYLGNRDASAPSTPSAPGATQGAD